MWNMKCTVTNASPFVSSEDHRFINQAQHTRYIFVFFRPETVGCGSCNWWGEGDSVIVLLKKQKRTFLVAVSYKKKKSSTRVDVI